MALRVAEFKSVSEVLRTIQTNQTRKEFRDQNIW